jgi:hypothetical protein
MPCRRVPNRARDAARSGTRARTVPVGLLGVGVSAICLHRCCGRRARMEIELGYLTLVRTGAYLVIPQVVSTLSGADLNSSASSRARVSGDWAAAH